MTSFENGQNDCGPWHQIGRPEQVQVQSLIHPIHGGQYHPSAYHTTKQAEVAALKKLKGKKENKQSSTVVLQTPFPVKKTRMPNYIKSVANKRLVSGTCLQYQGLGG